MKITTLFILFLLLIACSDDQNTDPATCDPGYIKQNDLCVIDENSCIASDISSLQQCIQQLNSGEKKLLHISKMIEIDQETGTFTLEDLSDVTIYGASETTTGFKKSGGYEKNVLVLRNCSNLTLNNLTFDDLAGARYNSDYASTIRVSRSSKITFNHVTIKGSKGVIALGVSKSTDFSLINATITDVGAFGLWVDETSRLLVQGCSFKDNRSNAIFIDELYGERWGDNIIEKSDFDHNHCDAVFNVCGDDDQSPCPGGQIDILNGTYLTIRENNIYNGKIETYPEITLYTSGIELNNGNHMLIEANKIWNNTGNCIYQNSGNTLTDVTIKNNEFTKMGDHACTRNMEQVTLENNSCN